jgi:hypothetical protein
MIMSAISSSPTFLKKINLCAILMLCSCSGGQDFTVAFDDDYTYSKHGYSPPSGLIISAAAAAGIAEIVGKGVYGDEEIERQKPFIISEKGDVWYVRGVARRPRFGGPMIFSGNLEIEISKTDGRIVRISHGK